MFAFVTIVISIALAVGLAATAAIYGSDAFGKGQAASAASALVTQAQQITSANELHNAEKGAYATAPDDLVPGGFLKATPQVPAVAKHATTPAWAMGASADVFKIYNSGWSIWYTNGTPSAVCDDAAAWARVNMAWAVPDGVGAVTNQAGVAYCRVTGASSSWNAGNIKKSDGTTDLSYAEYTAYVPAVGGNVLDGNSVYVRLQRTAAAESDEVCRQINKTSMGSSTIGGTATHTAGLGGFGTAAYAVDFSAIKTVAQGMTVKFGCARFGTDNVLIYKG